ncbi:hypothetical protein EXIGLDRAFT_753635 [Exidia glandulosa HHB12029]|uniref:Protein kinase domain-containing protein n=1 Tax=Exidia glandulosa HHB12029 TaxID=1314781 RepID=A0A165DKW3_EXIGL|nr:hypothetical protein EXIGLDRAFT_753635 [Exidia glandulosa HHB12029]
MSDAERIACCDDDVRDDFADDNSNEYATDNAIAEEHVHDPASLMPLGEYLTRYPNADRSLLCKQLAAQLSVYHNTQQLVHGDVKMANVMMDENGVAILPKSEKTVPITSQPRAPASPEERLPMTTGTDLYAFAWLVFRVYTDIDPLILAHDSKTMHLIASGIKPNRPGPDTLSTMRGLNDQIWEIMLRCWDLSPAARPRAAEVAHAFDPVHVASQPSPTYGLEDCVAKSGGLAEQLGQI